MISYEKKPLNELAAELYILTAEVKEKQKRIDAIKDQFRGKGSFYTKEYIIASREVKREMVGPTNMIIQKFGYEKLDEMGLIYNQTYLIVNVTAKGLPIGSNPAT